MRLSDVEEVQSPNNDDTGLAAIASGREGAGAARVPLSACRLGQEYRRHRGAFWPLGVPGGRAPEHSPMRVHPLTSGI